MKIIDKFPNTRDALDAYNNLVSKTLVSKTQSFDKWLESEFVESHDQALLDAAIGVIVTWGKWYENFSQLEDKINDLRSAIEREKNRPIRNCDKYKTVGESKMAFTEMCSKTKCLECKFKDTNFINCYSNWLYANANNEN